ncbi:MAG TPA: hypothetical protein VFT95_16780, partial [Micromonosporaceae bacterium]|nr:hypothetical protein [Micromonosporaceae bacterium]
GGGPAAPVTIDLTGPPAPQDGAIPSDAFEGITLGGKPDPDGPPECSDATAIVVDRQSAGAPFVTSARPDNLGLCRNVPILIRFDQAAASVQVELGGQGARRMEVIFKDLSTQLAPDLRAADDGRRNGIDSVLIRPISEAQSAELPPTAIRSITFTPLGTG